MIQTKDGRSSLRSQQDLPPLDQVLGIRSKIILFVGTVLKTPVLIFFRFFGHFEQSVYTHNLTYFVS